MKKLILFLFCLSVGTTKGQSLLHVVKTNDAINDFTLLEQEIHFSATGDIEIRPTNGGNSTIFAFAEVKEIRFSDLPSSVINPITAKESPYCKVVGSKLWIEGEPNLSQPQLITVFSLSGKVVNQLTQSLSQSIDIADIPKGIYLINFDNKTLKFIKL